MICTSNQDGVVGTTSPPASPETTSKRTKYMKQWFSNIGHRAVQDSNP